MVIFELHYFSFSFFFILNLSFLNIATVDLHEAAITYRFPALVTTIEPVGFVKSSGGQ